MKKTIRTIYKFILCLSLFECFLSARSLHAFLPTINEPTQEELEYTSIQMGKTAVQLIQFGQNNEAIKLLKLAIKLNPKEKDLWITLAEAQMRANKNHQALLSLDEVIKLNPEEENTYFTKASIYMELNDPKRAKDFVKKGLFINRNNERGYFQLGNAEIMLKNYKLALIAFKKSSKINSSFWQSINNEGLVLYELNNSQEAILKFKLALNISQNAEPMLALAILLYSSDSNSIESINLAKNALKADPQYILKEYQTKQLWGEKLQKSAELLFKNKKMQKSVREAKEKSQ
tara:strand:+ start:1067 stop:1936 length:870 start_codon:yes stop_codon:yes gene_type:complete